MTTSTINDILVYYSDALEAWRYILTYEPGAQLTGRVSKYADLSEPLVPASDAQNALIAVAAHFAPSVIIEADDVATTPFNRTDVAAAHWAAP